MKKVVSIAAIIVGALLLLSAAAPMIVGMILNVPSANPSMGIIGGADGPTAIVVAGSVSTGGMMITIAIGLLLIAAGILALVKCKARMEE